MIPARILINVVLPDPFAPMIPIFSPLKTDKFTFSTLKNWQQVKQNFYTK
jgi:hypothetical protein